jgi:hypothetical protein
MADAQSQQASVTPAPASSTEIVFLGTGIPRALPDHQGASLAIIVNGKLYLVDAGTGVVRQANAAYMAGTPASKVEGLNIAFITHVHSTGTAGPDLHPLGYWKNCSARTLRSHGHRGNGLEHSQGVRAG